MCFSLENASSFYCHLFIVITLVQIPLDVETNTYIYTLKSTNIAEFLIRVEKLRLPRALYEQKHKYTCVVEDSFRSRKY